MKRWVVAAVAVLVCCGPNVEVDPGDTSTESSSSSTTTNTNTNTNTTTSTSTNSSSGPATSSSSSGTVGTSSTTWPGNSTTGAPCGNGVVDPGEQCDGMDVQGFDCADVGLGEGPLLCSPETCTFDISACSEASTTGPSSSTGDSVCPDPDPNGGMCGNGVIDLGEQCDGANLQGFDCPSLGLGNGTLCCDPLTCTFDTSACTG